ncbi:MAG: hypothetical protein HN337_04885 [Deltaproteobacteria bacterium]|jgi:hypothetical protein|nr:hypothetical protein [Deltaproteobacteria bacterium]
MFSAGDGTLKSCTTKACQDFKDGITFRCSMVDTDQQMFDAGDATGKDWSEFLGTIGHTKGTPIAAKCEDYFQMHTGKLPLPMFKGMSGFYGMASAPSLPKRADVEKDMAAPKPKTADECALEGKKVDAGVCKPCDSDETFDAASKSCKATPKDADKVDEHQFVLGLGYGYSGSGWVQGTDGDFSDMSYMGDLGGDGGAVSHMVQISLEGRRRLMMWGKPQQHSGLFLSYGALLGIPISSRIMSSNGAVDSEPKAGFRGTAFVGLEPVIPVHDSVSLVVGAQFHLGGEYANLASTATGPIQQGRGILGFMLAAGIQINTGGVEDILSAIRLMGNVFFDVPIAGFSERSVLEATDSDVNGHQGQISGGIGGGATLQFVF